MATTTVNVLHGTTYTLTAADPSGVAATYYSVDGTYPSIRYTAPLTVNADTTLRFYSVDTVGNTEVPQSIKLAVGAPGIQALPAGASAFYSVCNVPGTNDFVAAGNNGYIYKVKAMGFWNPVGVFAGPCAWDNGGAQVVAVPGTPYIYLLSNDGVYRSSNYGEAESWSKIIHWSLGGYMTNAIYCPAVDKIRVANNGSAWLTYVVGASTVAPVLGNWNSSSADYRGIGMHADGSGFWSQKGTNIIRYNTNSHGTTDRTMPGRSLGYYGKFFDYDGSTVFFVGQEGGRLVIYRTNNGFVTWTNVYTSAFTGVSIKPYNTCYFNGANILVSFDRGTHTSIIKSTDMGVTWTEVYYDLQVTTSSSNAMASNGTYTWVVGNRLHRSLDMGNTWPSI